MEEIIAALGNRYSALQINAAGGTMRRHQIRSRTSFSGVSASASRPKPQIAPSDLASRQAMAENLAIFAYREE